MNKKVIKVLKIVGITLLVILAIALLAVGAMLLYSKNYKIPEQDAKIENNTGLIQAHNRSLYDAAGNQIQLTGINAGQILLQEGWMGPFYTEALMNEDGSYVKDDGGNIQYPEFTEEEFRQAIKENPNLNTYDIEEIMKIYWDCFFTEEDFRIIKEELKMNVIRLPFYYLNILNEDLSLKSEEDAFAYLDWFMSMAAKYELYIILDLHGAPGSQNGYEHSGTADRVEDLWDNEKNVAATVALWDFVSMHYTQTKPELGKWIATYDILNEPTYGFGGVTNKKCWDVFDQIYDVIRENNDKHVVTMEGCWNFSTLPNPADYGWENVQYEYHWYNWWSDMLPYDILYMYHDFTNLGRDYNVPVLLGEFTLFEDKAAWEKELKLFDDRNYSWTIWNYKTTVTGWWTSSWGVYTAQLKAVTENEDTKCNIATCTYDEYVATCEKMKTENCAKGTLWDVIMEYNERNNK